MYTKETSRHSTLSDNLECSPLGKIVYGKNTVRSSLLRFDVHKNKLPIHVVTIVSVRLKIIFILYPTALMQEYPRVEEDVAAFIENKKKKKTLGLSLRRKSYTMDRPGFIQKSCGCP
jgi:hypothetical protein